jgi:hypothetical protein
MNAVTDLNKRLLVLEKPPIVTPPPVEPPPVITPPPGIKVTSIQALLNALADNNAKDIVVANGRYPVAPVHTQQATSLWIGSRFAGRTNPVVVRAETPGEVIFDGGGANTGHITFVDGAHDQDWRGFSLDNAKPYQSGSVVFGAYGKPAPHHISLRKLSVLRGIVAATANNDHAMYFSSDAWHDVLIEDYLCTPGAGIKSALQFYHAPNGYNLTVRRMKVDGAQPMSAILIYEGSVRDVLIEDSQITGTATPLNVNACGPNVVLRRVVSNTGRQPYYPSGKPAGLILENCTWG